MFSNISYRFKLPMYLITAAAFTATISVMVVSWQYYTQGKQSISIHSQELSNSMSNMLIWSLTHKDIWHAYTLLRGPEANLLAKPRHTYIVFDNKQTIFASNQPRQFPTGTHVSKLQAESNAVLKNLQNATNSDKALATPIANRLLSSFPLASDSVIIGYLVIIDNFDAITALFNRISLLGLIVVLILLSVITPIAWFWGKRIANPLLNLESCILRIGKEPLENIKCLIPNNHDEIGRLSRHFQGMVTGLKEKQDLEKKLVESERLAAVGTLTASVAHEINNPLAGMMMAVDTYKRHCSTPACRQRESSIAAIELVERGLIQIQETVNALLSNVKAYDKPLSRVDIEDIFKLTAPNSNKKYIKFDCHNEIHDTVNISSTCIRQVLINLLLNAIHATNNNGHIVCHSRIDNDSFKITIKNDGDPIPDQQMKHLFDPRYSTKYTGSGLGLWVTHQIAQQLQGSITAQREAAWTVFEVVLPITRNLAQ